MTNEEETLVLVVVLAAVPTICDTKKGTTENTSPIFVCKQWGVEGPTMVAVVAAESTAVWMRRWNACARRRLSYVESG